MQLTYWEKSTQQQQKALLSRPAVNASNRISTAVKEIIEQVRCDGDKALLALTAKFDKTQLNDIRVSQQDIDAASARLGDEIKQAMAIAARNIETFHSAQAIAPVDIETQPGVRCQQVTRPIRSVGLYIPGGTAPLPSTVLMLGIPSRLAGCSQVVLC